MIDIRIRSLELKDTPELDGVVDIVRTIVTIEGTSMFKNFDLEDASPDNFIALEQITDELVKGWIKPKLETDLPAIKKDIFQKNKDKKKKAVKTTDADGKVKYTREDHVDEWMPGVTYSKGKRLHYQWETVETVDTGEVDEQGNPITEQQTVEHIEFVEVQQDHVSQEGLEPHTAASLYSTTFTFAGNFPKWKMPVGIKDAYPKGFIVYHIPTAQVWQAEADDTTTEPPTGWKEYKKKSADFPKWKDKTDYVIGNTVQYGGEYYIAIADHTSDKEDTPDVSTNWEVYIAPTSPTYDKWKDKTDYTTGDIVEYKGINYIAIQDHTSAKGQEPGVDATLWEVYTEAT